MPVRFLTDTVREQLSGFPAELDSEALDRFFTFSEGFQEYRPWKGPDLSGRFGNLPWFSWGS